MPYKDPGGAARHRPSTLNGSLYLGRVLGIHIRVHYLFLMMMAAIVLIAGAPMALTMLLLFGLVLLHELGHSLVAQSFGIRVLDITFWPLGGMARMSEIPEDSRIEGWIAIAGPLVNFALAGLALPFFLLGGGTAAQVFTVQAGASLLGQFILLNLVLGTFNLLPAFPMDGGRVLRAILGRNGDWVGATEKAVRGSRYLALLMLVAGIYTFNCMLAVIAFFVWTVGARELFAVRLRHGLSPFGNVAVSFGGRSPFEAFFGPLDPAARGHFRNASLDADAGPPKGPRRPAEPLARRRDERGISDEEVERLERFRGRLRGFGEE